MLLARRPDLQYLPLTCANTNTALPYIDIVNETLEYFVANGLSLAGYQGHDTGDTVTSAELVASPQYVNDAAYGTCSRRYFPPPLPFNRPLELLRLHWPNLGVALPAAMAALRANDDLSTPRRRPATAGPTSSSSSSPSPATSTGCSPTPTLPARRPLRAAGSRRPPLTTFRQMSLQDFSRRLGVSYDDLVAIVQTQFINPNAALIPRLQQLNARSRRSGAQEP